MTDSRKNTAAPHKALLLAAHGSRLQSSNEEFETLAGRISASLQGDYDRVATAFLELAEPGIDTVLDRLATAGASEIRVKPCFLLAGTHVRNDIPAIVSAARERHPEVRIELLPHLAADDGFVEYLTALAR